MKFVTQQIANISTTCLTESDAELISRIDAPYHLAAHDTGRASFFFSPTEDRAVQQQFVSEARTFGLSEGFIAIMLELTRQGIPYVRFDVDGGNVEELQLSTSDDFRP